ncbi:MAG: hypothetical protein IKN87_01675 [Bacilli bacterium]|nr:hypothetical protein [Bacilli bacterium]
MYEEKKIKIPYRDIALQLIVIVLFVLVLLWLFPSKKIMKNSEEKNNGQSVEKNNNSKNNNSDINNDSNNSQNNNEDKNNDDNKKTTAKKYEYAKTSEVSYGEYGPWSDWSTNYIAPSDTIEVQTEVRSSTNGWKSNYVQTGTKTEENVVVGTKTDNKVVTGYNVEYISTIGPSTKPINNTDDYIYVLTKAHKIYTCDDGDPVTMEIYGAPITSDKVNYDYLITQNGDLSKLNPPASCSNAKVFNEQYEYTLYKRVPIYTTVTEDIYGTVTTPIYTEQKETTYGNVTYYRYRTRSYKAGGESIKWSDSDNDQTLISQGYHFTGNVK